MMTMQSRQRDYLTASVNGNASVTPLAAAICRFGAQIDVRKRGALRLGPSARGESAKREQPAVVRIWNGEDCRELTAHEARALAAQLAAAAQFADEQNLR